MDVGGLKLECRTDFLPNCENYLCGLIFFTQERAVERGRNLSSVLFETIFSDLRPELNIFYCLSNYVFSTKKHTAWKALAWALTEAIKKKTRLEVFYKVRISKTDEIRLND